MSEQDIVGTIQRLLRPDQRDERFIGDSIASLSVADLTRVIELATSYARSGREEATTLALWLAAFTAADLSELQSALIDAGKLDPGIIFRGAPAHIRERLWSFVGPNDDLRRDRALVASAWAANDATAARFAPWPIYPLEAGWEWTPANVRRRLYITDTFALVPPGSPDEESAVTAGGPADGTCAWCGHPLMTLLHSRRPGLPARVVTCANCTAYGPIFMQLDPSGEATWHPGNHRPDYLHTEYEGSLPTTARLVMGHPRGPLHAAHLFLPTTVSQIGGAPGWVDDAAYPQCPSCGVTMLFIAQVSPEELTGEPWEGMDYLFWCEPCAVTATGYQQT